MEEIIKRLIQFRDERNWEQFHTPDHLANSIVIEAAELLENFQWMGFVEPDMENIKDELADIMAYCLMMMDHYHLDFNEIMNRKIDKNELKYPKDLAYGKADKYTKLK